MFKGPVGLTDGGKATNDSTEFPTGYVLNALAYNSVDRYMYMVVNADNNVQVASNDIVRVNSDGSLEHVFTANFPSLTNLKGAAFSTDGTYYAIGVSAGGNDKLFAISGLDTAPATPAMMSIVNLSTPVNMGGIAFDHTNGTLYAVSNVTNLLYSIDPATGNVTTISTGAANGPGVSIGTNGIGSLYMTATGKLVGYINVNSTDTEG